MRRILFIISALLCLVVLAPLALLAALQTEAARTFTERKVAEALTIKGRNVDLGALRIDWDGTIHAASLEVADDNGTWFKARGIRATWSPLALLEGRLSIGSVRIEEIEVARRPNGLGESEVQASAKPAQDGGLPIDVDIPQIIIGDIRLANAVAGTPIRLTARASVRLRADPAIIEAAVHVERDDDVSGRFDAAVGYVQDNPFLRIDLRASEPRGGLMARLLRIEALPAVDTTLSGEGRLDSWHGRLSVALNRRETVTGRLDLTRSADKRQLALSLDGALAEILPPAMRDVFAGALHVKGTADLDEDYTPLGGHLDMTSDAITLSAKGDYDRESNRLAADLDAKLSRPASWGEDNSRIAADDLEVQAHASGSLSDADWRATVNGAGISAPQGHIESLSLKAGGDSADLRAESLNVPISFDGNATLAAFSRPDLQPLAGPLSINAKGRLRAGNAFDLDTLDIRTAVAQATLSGTYSRKDAAFAGDIAFTDLSALSGVARRPLRGDVTAHVNIEGDPSSEAGTLKLNATAQGLETGDDRLNALLGGKTRLTATLARDTAGGIEISDAVLSGSGVEAKVSGKTDLATVNAKASVRIVELKSLDARISGALSLQATVSGTLSSPDIDARLSSERLVMQGEPVEGLEATVKGSAPDGRAQGRAELDATFRGQPLSATVTLKSDADGTRHFNDIAVEAANSRLEGHMALGADGRPNGTINLNAPDLAEIAPLLLQDLAGSLTARVDVGPSNGQDTARISVRTKNLKRADLTIASADLDATITNPLATPGIEGTIAARGIHQGGVTVTTLTGNANHNGDVTEFTAKADLEDGALALDGKLEPEGDGFAVTLANAGGTWKGLQTRLKAPAKIVVTNSTATLHDVVLALGNGTATVSGSAGSDLDIDLRLESVPMSLANAVAPGLGLQGSLSGTGHASGAASDPQASWDLTWSDAGAAQATTYGLPAMTVKSQGHLKDKTVTQTSVASIGDGQLTAKGDVNLSAQPAVLDIKVNGTLPLSIAQRRLLDAGLRMEGTANLDMSIGGTTAKPDYGGTISGSNLTAIGLDTGVTLKSLNVTARFSPQQLEVTSLTGELGGGKLSGKGTLGLGQGMPANFAVKISDATYQDGAIVKARFDADMTFVGPLAGSPELSGNVLLKRTDITIPETLSGKISPLSVKHINAPQSVRNQTKALDEGDGSGNSGGGAIRLNLSVHAPGQIFVRGRGLQAELAGTVQITGTTAAPTTAGGFTLRRGTLGVLSRQLTFTKGTISFLGSFDPRLDFAATTSTSDAEVTVSVTGNASDPKITFSSSPEMPQDEVLAQLLFGQSLSNLSAAQIAQLASALATLGGNDPLDRLRQTLGVDSINLTTDEDNNTSVNLGKNIGDKLRLGVQQGTASSSSRVTIDLDINKTLRARGEVGEDGGSKAGIYFEKEY
ncbi:autotransporter secretion inner membrane protein TamB [Breoghania corrubedonensis]|uniref:Autotransporter secretion inner membrane protein TamB n=1 Tax=Breoghania corrubedonensis TaxID=665038 RepID=A0A2T5VBB2_9HYPH|nr:translocation/assembly module TamB domain-containing protein [Breoghania corrubedonensis]PTW61043.1 autotransporter secretion inner membrane protein TamB [Breoghania corrubedonensis]